MSMWVEAFCRKSVASATAGDLHKAIAERLESLTFLVCPENEEDPDEVLSRLKVEETSRTRSNWSINIFYRQDGRPITAALWSGEQALTEAQEFLEEIEDFSEPEAQIVREVLANVTESVAIELKQSDVEGMGWPVAIGAMAGLAEVGDGVIRVTDYAWMVPEDGEVRVLLREGV